MSFSRYSEDCDIYLYGIREEKTVCHECKLNDHKDNVIDTYKQVLEHIEYHKEAGDQVPDYVIDQIEIERIRNLE